MSGFFNPVTKEVFQVGGGALTSPEDAAVYLIACEGHYGVFRGKEAVADFIESFPAGC